MKGSVGTSTELKFFFYGLRGYTPRMMNVYRSILKTSKDNVVAFRLQVIAFHKQYGFKATQKAFGVSKPTLYRWKKALKDSGGKTESLALKSRAPKHPRQPETPESVVSFIQQYRRLHPGVGKEAITPVLDDFCALKGIKTVSESTVGRVLKRLKKQGRLDDERTILTVDARTGKLREKKKVKRKKLRRKGFLPEKAGDLVQMDSITRFVHGVKRYLITAIDVWGRFSFAYGYSHLSSQSAKDFMEKFLSVAPFPVKHIQTDNGKEFAHYFRDYVSLKTITHFHTYPKHPKSNAYVERFNRTVQEQFVDYHEEEMLSLPSFNHALMDYLLWYNTEKPHKGLKNLTPLRYYLSAFTENSEKSHMLWTLTDG